MASVLGSLQLPAFPGTNDLAADPECWAAGGYVDLSTVNSQALPQPAGKGDSEGFQGRMYTMVKGLPRIQALDSIPNTKNGGAQGTSSVCKKKSVVGQARGPEFGPRNHIRKPDVVLLLLTPVPGRWLPNLRLSAGPHFEHGWAHTKHSRTLTLRSSWYLSLFLAAFSSSSLFLASFTLSTQAPLHPDSSEPGLCQAQRLTVPDLG